MAIGYNATEDLNQLLHDAPVTPKNAKAFAKILSKEWSKDMEVAHMMEFGYRTRVLRLIGLRELGGDDGAKVCMVLARLATRKNTTRWFA
jgi:hypothetical protein